MSKNIFDEAIETLLSAGTTFIAVPCNPIGEENSDMIHLRNATPDYESEVSKVVKVLELGKLYKELITVKDEIISVAYFDTRYYNLGAVQKEIDLKKQIKELENENTNDTKLYK